MPHDSVDLAWYRHTGSPRTNKWPICPSRGHLRIVNHQTGLVVPGRCGRLRCHACLVPAALDYGAAIGLARPDHLVLLTQVGRDWEEIHSRMHRVRQTLTRSGCQSEWVYHVEPNPRRTGNHIHLWLRAADFVPDRLLNAAARAGMGAEFATARRYEPMLGETAPLLTYGMKACSYAPDGATALWPAAEQYLQLNSGQLGHATRGFWRDALGRPIRRVRDAIRAARQARGQGGPCSIVA